MAKKVHSTPINQISSFLTNKKFILNLIAIIGCLLLVLVIVIMWLRIYTHHGEKLEMPNYIDRPVSYAIQDAKRQSFELIVNDSVHIVGKEGGVVINQNPSGGSFVKSGRKLYVTITKFKPDVVDISEVFPLYGQDYEMKKTELQRKSISSQIKEYRFDPLTNNSILEVWKDGELVISRDLDPNSLTLEKGSVLDFVLSSPEGGTHEIPDMVGVTVKRARWIANKFKLNIGSISVEGEQPDDIESAIVLSQSPVPDGVSTMSTGDSIDLIVKKND